MGVGFFPCINNKDILIPLNSKLHKRNVLVPTYDPYLLVTRTIRLYLLETVSLLNKEAQDCFFVLLDAAMYKAHYSCLMQNKDKNGVIKIPTGFLQGITNDLLVKYLSGTMEENVNRIQEDYKILKTKQANMPDHGFPGSGNDVGPEEAGFSPSLN